MKNVDMEVCGGLRKLLLIYRFEDLAARLVNWKSRPECFDLGLEIDA